MRARVSVLVGNSEPHVLCMAGARYVNVENSGLSVLCMEGARCVSVGNKGPHVLSTGGRFSTTLLYGAYRLRSGQILRAAAWV